MARRISLQVAAALLSLSLLAPAGLSFAGEAGRTTQETVVLLHGLTRSPASMSDMAEALEKAGYHVCNVGYPSREHQIETLAADFVAPAIRRCAVNDGARLHFVTHSLGGIMVRQLVATGAIDNVGRVVMLAPPNHGSEVVDKLSSLWLFGTVGPAARQLGTGTDSLPNRLGPAPFELGIITGTRSINWIMSTLIPGKDDGKVSVASAQLEGMRDFLVIASSHPFIMRNERVKEQTLHFLEHGVFLREQTQARLP